MCYLPLETSAAAAESMDTGYVMPQFAQSTTSSSESSATTESVSKKRKAGAQIQDGPAKRTRSSCGDDRSETAASHASTGGIDYLSEYQKMQKQLVASNAKVEQLRQELGDADDERLDWQTKAQDYEEEVRELKASKKGGEIERTAAIKMHVKKAEDAQKLKFEKKLSEVEEKRKAGLRAKHQSCQNKIDELKAIQQDDLSAMREEVARAKRDTKEAKEDFVTECKRLKREQQDEIRKHKPDTAAAVKEEKKKVKALEVDVDTLTKKLATEKHLSERRGAAVDALGDEKKELQGTIGEHKSLEELLRKEIGTKQDYITRLLHLHAQEKLALDHKIQHEGQRWQVQYDLTQQYKAELTQQQRGNTAARHANESKQRQVQTLKTQNEQLMARVQALEADVIALRSTTNYVDVGTNSTNVENSRQGLDVMTGALPAPATENGGPDASETA